MKPYGKTDKDYGDTGCCPGHDNPRITKWSGWYNSDNSRRASRKLTKIQNRSKRRVLREEIKNGNF